MKRITHWILALLAIVGLRGSFTQAQQSSSNHDNSVSPKQTQTGNDSYPIPNIPNPDGSPTSDGSPIP